MEHIRKRIAKNTLSISLGTLLSRISGFIRDILLARFFGVSWVVESFFVAFRIPNLLRELVGEGGVDSISVPVLSGHKNDVSKAQNQLLSLILYAVTALAALGIIFSMYLVVIIAPGFALDSTRFALTVLLSQVLFLFLFFSTLAASLSTMMYTAKKFLVPSLTPMILNAAMIVCLVIVRDSFERSVIWLAWSAVLSAVLQFLVHYYFVFKDGYRLRLWGLSVMKTAIASQVARLFMPRIVGVSIYQLNVLIDTFLSSFSGIVGAGAVAALYYTNRIYQFPLALFSLAVGRAMLPELSDLKRSNMAEFKKVFLFSLQSVAFCVIPFSFFFMFFSVPIVEAVFKRGTFDDYSVVVTAIALFGYSFGLFFIAANRIIVSGFYSLEDTRTPARVAFIALCINALLSCVLMFPFKVAGITVASSISSLASFIFGWRALHKKIGGMPYKNTFWCIIRIVLASSVMCLIIGYTLSVLPISIALARLCSAVFLGGIGYVAAGCALKVEQAVAFVAGSRRLVRNTAAFFFSAYRNVDR